MADDKILDVDTHTVTTVKGSDNEINSISYDVGIDASIQVNWEDKVVEWIKGLFK